MSHKSILPTRPMTPGLLDKIEQLTQNDEVAGLGRARQRAREGDTLMPSKIRSAKLGKALAKVVTIARGNAGSRGTTCVCGHAIEEHGHDPEYPGSTACQADGVAGEDAPGDGCDCIAYESEG